MMAIVNLACGCFFSGRDFIAAENCQEHSDEWSCDNCGESAMDGSGQCITCGAVNESQCDECGKWMHIDLLDSKPSRPASWIRRCRQNEGQLTMLRRAADKGFDFDRLECSACYGPGYEAMP